MLDIYTGQQAYKLHEISNIGLVRKNHNLADGLTKVHMKNSLYNPIFSGKHESEAEKCIRRDIE